MQKDTGFDALRVFAITLIVGLHITNDVALSDYKDFFEFINYTFQNTRLPLFTVISGYIYSRKEYIIGSGYLKFVKGKFRRLIIPLFSVSFLDFFLKATLLDKRELGDIWKIFIYPEEHYWFLQVIFIIFLIMPVMRYLGLFKSNTRLLLTILLASLLLMFYKSFNVDIPYFSLGTTTYLLPYFLLGFALGHKERSLSNFFYLSIITIFIISFSLSQLGWWYEVASLRSGKSTLLGIVIGFSSCMLLIRFRFDIFKISSLGSYVFSMYLLQAFGSGIGRVILNKLNIEGLPYFISLVLMTLLFGVIAHIVLSKNSITSLVFIGIKKKSNKIKDAKTCVLSAS